jgi:drug/metabolite transporter (DMT)-like permease
MKSRAWFYLILANLFWAGNMIFGKYTSVDFPAVWTDFLRWAIAMIILLPMAQIIEKPSWLQILKRQRVLIIVMSASGVVLYNTLIYTALQYTSSTNGALINSLTPAVIVLFSLVKHRRFYFI